MSDAVAPDDDVGGAARQGVWVQRRLSGVAGAAATQLVCRPDRLAGVLASAPEGRSLIARGGGQSGGDAALNDGGAVLLTTRLDRMLSFDAKSGVLVAEAGVTIGDVLRTFLPRGFAPAVCPAASRTTLGGAIAADVHGSNHVRAGAFGAHVLWLDLVSPRDGLRRVAPDDNPELFDATIGGMGLTGVIARAAVRLVPEVSGFVDVRHEAAATLESLLERLVTASRAHEHAVAWIDAVGGGMAQGRGVLETADAAITGDLGEWQLVWPSAMSVRSAAGAGVAWRGPLRRLRDEHRYRRARGGTAPRRLALDRFLFRAEAGVGGRRLGRFQCVVPADGAAAAIRRLLDIVRRGGGTARASAGAMGDQGRGMLSFPRPGISLTLELPIPVVAPDLMRRLERETLDRGGRVFLAYDSHLTDHGFAAMYPRLDDIRAVVARVDPDMRLQSDLARRLRLRDYVV